MHACRWRALRWRATPSKHAGVPTGSRSERGRLLNQFVCIRAYGRWHTMHVHVQHTCMRHAWQVSDELDRYARGVLPASYGFAMLVLFHRASGSELG